MKKLTKANIDELAKEIRRWANRYKLGKDWLLFYNGKMMHSPLDENYRYKRSRIEKGVNPLDYCEWYSDDFIMGMAYDGMMYDCINGYGKRKAYKSLEKLLMSYGLYLEHCDSCHCEFVNLNNGKVEATKLKRKQIVRLYRPGRADLEHSCGSNVVIYPRELDRVMEFWFNESSKVGDIGACVMGEYLQFDYKGDTYRMSSQSPYQGECSWTEPLPKVKEILKEMGATEIFYNPGHLD